MSNPPMRPLRMSKRPSEEAREAYAAGYRQCLVEVKVLLEYLENSWREKE